MKTLGLILKYAREAKGMTLRNVSEELNIDQSLVCKFERSDRLPTHEQLIKFSDFYGLVKDELIINWYSDKIVSELKNLKSSEEILKMADLKLNDYKTEANGK